MVKLKKNWIKKIAFGNLGIWALSIIAFLGLAVLFNANTVNGNYTNTQSQIILGVVIIGVISFLIASVSFAILITKTSPPKEHKAKPNFDLGRFLIPALMIVIFITAYALIGPNSSLIGGIQKTFTKPTPTLTPIPTLDIPTTDTPTPTTIYYAPKPTINSDPIITCNIYFNCGGGTRQMKKSECDQSICCQLGNTWDTYPNKTACTQAQNNYNSSKTSGANYPPCTVYYPALGYSRTYSYTSSSQCSAWQQQAKSNSSTAIQAPVNTPIPTQDNSEYNNLLKQHQEACQRVVAEWNTIKENFYANEYNNYSSSAEAVQELERRRQAYQQEAYSVGCTQTISLY